MATVHLICGFMGFGKTTAARKLALQQNAVRLTPDELMVAFYGRNPPEPEFRLKWKIIDDFVWHLAEQIVQAGGNVILDYGFWSREERRQAFEKAKIFCDRVVFHQIECDMAVAKERVLSRSKTDGGALDIDENCFDMFAQKYEPISPEERYEVIYYRHF